MEACAHLDAVAQLREDYRPSALAAGLVPREVLSQHLLELDLSCRDSSKRHEIQKQRRGKAICNVYVRGGT